MSSVVRLFSRLWPVPLLAWVAVTVVMSFLTATLLRENNFRMGELREQIYVADQAGDELGARAAAGLLADYTSSHMNTDVGGEIHLAVAYAAAVEKAQEAFYAQDDVTSNLYDQAQAACEDPNILLSLRAECVQDFVSERTVGSGVVQTQIDLPDAEKYKFNFTSPAWSPDLAGLFLMTTVIVGCWTAIRLLIKGIYS